LQIPDKLLFVFFYLYFDLVQMRSVILCNKQICMYVYVCIYTISVPHVLQYVSKFEVPTASYSCKDNSVCNSRNIWALTGTVCQILSIPHFP